MLLCAGSAGVSHEYHVDLEMLAGLPFQGLRDQGTGSWRHALQSRMELEWERWRAPGSPIALAFVDQSGSLLQGGLSGDSHPSAQLLDTGICVDGIKICLGVHRERMRATLCLWILLNEGF